MKAMRSTKEGTKCADCGAEIHVGDPIAYFGPGRVYGLTCHVNEKTTKYLRRLEEVEAQLVGEERTRGGFPELDEVEKQKLQFRSGTGVGVDSKQEWCVRLELENERMGNEGLRTTLGWLLKARYCGQLAQALNVVEFRAPRNVATQMTKTWAESVAKELSPWGKAEAQPLW